MKYLLLIIALILPQLSYARPHSCNGRIQQFPCQYTSEQLTGGVRQDAKHPSLDFRAGLKNRKTPSHEGSARVLNAKFTRASSGRGLWKGHFIGEGKVHLFLDLLKGDELLESRPMGSTQVSLDEGPVSFAFESPLPTSIRMERRTLSWKVRALTE